MWPGPRCRAGWLTGLGPCRLLDVVPKHQLFYYVGLFYFVVFSAVAWMLASPTYGLANSQASPYRLLGEWASRLLAARACTRGGADGVAQAGSPIARSRASARSALACSGRS
jgi:hypothetical protein